MLLKSPECGRLSRLRLPCPGDGGYLEAKGRYLLDGEIDDVVTVGLRAAQFGEVVFGGVDAVKDVKHFSLQLVG